MAKTHTQVDPKLLPKSNLQKAKWESSNEGVHERVNFDDTIWGFDLAGGAKYGTPLRVTKVKRNSRADKAGIRKGDKLKRINDILTETLTLQEAHDIILESGIYIRLAVTAPEDTDTTFSSWQDEEEYWDEEEEEKKRLEELAKKRRIVCKTNSNWSLMWPWVTRKTYIYKESNCFLVPSAYETKHKDRLTPSPEPTTIALYPTEKHQLKQSSDGNEISEEKNIEDDQSLNKEGTEGKDENLTKEMIQEKENVPNESISVDDYAQDSTEENHEQKTVIEENQHENEPLEEYVSEENQDKNELLEENITEENQLNNAKDISEDIVEENRESDTKEIPEDDTEENPDEEFTTENHDEEENLTEESLPEETYTEQILTDETPTEGVLTEDEKNDDEDFSKQVPEENSL